jgi:DNA repair exonuclease SbcCD nuclease subunit
VKFIHSSDLQIGKAFGTFAADTALLLQEARQTAVRALGDAAIAHGASAVLIAGDVFEREQMSQSTLMRALETMRAFPRTQWHLLPGNHDHYRENGLWDRLARAQLPANVHLHVQPGAVEIADDDGVPVYLLPAPLFFRASADDPTAYMRDAATPDGALRIGMAHGSIQGFGSDGEASNLIDPGRADSAGLTYLALGDWHRQIKVGDRCWYSGTPEPDRFKRPPQSTGSLCNGGAALLVEIGSARATPVVTPVQTGHYQWHQLETTLTDDAQVAPLEQELRALGSDLSKIVLDLRARGSLSLEGRETFEELILQGVGAAMRALRFNESGLVLHPTEQDLDDIDRSGFVRVAADRLKAMAEDTADPQQAKIAGLALKRLYIEHLRQGGAA